MITIKGILLKTTAVIFSGRVLILEKTSQNKRNTSLGNMWCYKT